MYETTYLLQSGGCILNLMTICMLLSSIYKVNLCEEVSHYLFVLSKDITNIALLL